ncbi:zinc finger protein ZAT5-like [Impatiens glandulifera]|uniref:zinc finger protein ZAT5-like n=1 Tax=Impatiens glandulifera TaxID=253017 RepID=UPI001FB105DB|nr:zinc finger protein ZAT5-like [Impatiens glandulifera]
MVFEKKMEALQEEFNLDQRAAAIIKGKRTKRPRQSSPLVAATSTSSTTSGEISMMTSSEEDEDMANCLILLAQGIRSPAADQNRVDEQGDLDCDNRKKDNNNNSVVVSDAYECKTCNRTFPSFQALGGHRASHKKPKIMITQEKQSLTTDHGHGHGHDHDKVIEIIDGGGGGGGEKEIHEALKVRLISKISNTQSNKVHECSICGAEFSSGQALGGHMRRHRSPPATATATATLGPSGSGGRSINEEEDDEKKKKNKKSRNLLELDLNLPAPVEDDKFQYISPKMVFSGPSLVGCHY